MPSTLCWPPQAETGLWLSQTEISVQYTEPFLCLGALFGGLFLTHIA